MLKKENRLLTNYEFRKVRRLGKRYKGPYFTLYYLETKNNEEAPSRFGIVVSNKFDKSAVKRNRVKRLFREVVRLNLDKLKVGFWVVIYPNKASEDKNYEEINIEFNKVLSKIPLTK